MYDLMYSVIQHNSSYFTNCDVIVTYCLLVYFTTKTLIT